MRTFIVTLFLAGSVLQADTLKNIKIDQIVNYVDAQTSVRTFERFARLPDESLSADMGVSQINASLRRQLHRVPAYQLNRMYKFATSSEGRLVAFSRNQAIFLRADDRYSRGGPRYSLVKRLLNLESRLGHRAHTMSVYRRIVKSLRRRGVEAPLATWRANKLLANSSLSLVSRYRLYHAVDNTTLRRYLEFRESVAGVRLYHIVQRALNDALKLGGSDMVVEHTTRRHDSVHGMPSMLNRQRPEGDRYGEEPTLEY